MMEKENQEDRINGLQARVRTLEAELEKAKREMDEFAHIASHDLKAPLRSISSFSELLNQDLEGKLDGGTQELFDLISTSTTRMTTLVNDLLTFSRVKTQGKEFAQVNLNETFKVLLLHLNSKITETGAEIEIGDLPNVWGDRAQVQQLFGSLLDNSLKFVRPETAPRIKIELLAPADQKAQMCAITVTDEGIGFATDKADEMFKPCNRLVGKAEFPGNGMGLAVAKKIVLRHGGVISGVGEKDRGATFKVTLPLYCGPSIRDSE